ncbi:MAG TPA: 30S ribosomal protein S16 [Candidatus Saccharimonadales bacterium]|nr:30S ribosomal protein S16 [Candidatus Saccharimonadales bacterium]
MLAIRLQRTGRSGHAQFRIIVQDSRFSPTRGRVVAYLGSYNPHTKTATVDSEQAAKYLENGAQPSDRVARLLQKEGVKLPSWVSLSEPKKRDVRNPEKRRSTAPAQPEAPAPGNEAPSETEAEAPAAEEAASEKPGTEEAPQQPAETPAETESEEKPAE